MFLSRPRSNTALPQIFPMKPSRLFPLAFALLLPSGLFAGTTIPAADLPYQFETPSINSGQLEFHLVDPPSSTPSNILSLRFKASGGTSIFEQSSSALGAEWQWLVGGDDLLMYLNYLNSVGTLGVIDPTGGGSGAWLNTPGSLILKDGNDNTVTLNAQGSWIFEDANQTTVSLTIQPPLQALPARLLINNEEILTQTVADGRYLSATLANLNLGPGSNFSIGATTLTGSNSLAGGAGTILYGNNSLAFGSNAKVGALGAAAHDAVALGAGANAVKEGAMAFGRGAKALQKQSLAIGQEAEASSSENVWWDPSIDWGSMAIGTRARALGTASVALGPGTQAYGDISIALGLRAMTWPGAAVGIALGYEAVSWQPNALTIGNSTHGMGEMSTAVGNVTYAIGHTSAAFGSYSEAISTGQIAVGVAPRLASASANWDDLNAEVFVVGGGKPGPLIGNPHAGLQAYDVTRRSALTLQRSGELKLWNQPDGTPPANPIMHLQPSGDLKVKGAMSADATTGYNKFKAPILVPQSGDIDMGEFTAGEQP
jgi:hypothetical protein